MRTAQRRIREHEFGPPIEDGTRYLIRKRDLINGLEAFFDCWVDDEICFEGDKQEAALLLSDLFDELWSGERLFEDLNDEGEAIQLFSVGEDGESVVTVPGCGD